MRRILLVASLLLVLRLAPGHERLFGGHLLGQALGVLTFLTGALTLIYYVPKGIAWFWRGLMWRVRRGCPVRTTTGRCRPGLMGVWVSCVPPCPGRTSPSSGVNPPSPPARVSLFPRG